jgi:hypothetical protein
MIAGDLVRLAVSGQHDLLVVLVQRVERVEELVLRALLAGEELDVVDEQDIDAFSVVATKLVHPTGADRWSHGSRRVEYVLIDDHSKQSRMGC